MARVKEDSVSEFITIRIPGDLAEFVNRQADAMCNTRAGVIRFALTQLRRAVEAEEGATSKSEQPEEVPA